MLESFLAIGILDGPLLTVVYGLAAAAFAALLVRRRLRHWWLTALLSVVAGAATGLVVLWALVDLIDAFGEGAVAHETYFWIAAAFAGTALALANFWMSRWWRKLIAVAGVALFIVAAVLGVNASFGLNPTVGSLFGISTTPDIKVPEHTDSSADPSAPLWQSWHPPADMPATGEVGEVDIPSTASGWDARPAQLYLPPAALVDDPPELPFILMMMGQPGNPDAGFVGEVLDRFAAEHDGLAPIVLVVDQLGEPEADPLCLDTAMGHVETYVMTDAVGWARDRLNILEDRRFWAVAGYSNGGGCAAYYGAKYPDVWGGIISLSGVKYPGVEHSAQVLEDVFGGDEAAYDAVKPTTIMGAHRYTDTTAVFTAGEDDPAYVEWAEANDEAAAAAGMDTTLVIVPEADHGVSALTGGLDAAFPVFYPRWTLAAP